MTTSPLVDPYHILAR